MTYELAKELEDAGFPRTKYTLRKYSLAAEPIELPTPPEGMEIGVLSGKMEWQVPAPTLSELIEACGEIMFTLNGTATRNKTNTWCAYTGHDMAVQTKALGATPEEAVARLWLALNKKL